MLEFKYLGCVLNKSSADEKSVLERWRVGGLQVLLGALVNASGLQPECARTLHEELLMLVLMYGSGTMIWKEKGCINGQPQRFSKYQENG